MATNYRDLLNQHNDAYADFLRSTPDPDEPHVCRDEPFCILCDLVRRHADYEERLYWIAFNCGGPEAVRDWEHNAWLHSDEPLIRDREDSGSLIAVRGTEAD